MYLWSRVGGCNTEEEGSSGGGGGGVPRPVLSTGLEL